MFFTRILVLFTVSLFLSFYACDNSVSSSITEKTNLDNDLGCVPVSGHTYSWTSSSGQNITYDIYIDNDSDFNSPELQRTNLAVNYFVQGTHVSDTDPLQYSTLYNFKKIVKQNGIIVDQGVTTFQTCTP